MSKSLLTSHLLPIIQAFCFEPAFFKELNFILFPFDIYRDTVTHNVFQMFSDYQMQEMSENFIDSFGFQDDEFTDADMNIRLRD